MVADLIIFDLAADPPVPQMRNLARDHRNAEYCANSDDYKGHLTPARTTS
jgi:hypothetical protein